MSIENCQNDMELTTSLALSLMYINLADQSKEIPISLTVAEVEEFNRKLKDILKDASSEEYISEIPSITYEQCPKIYSEITDEFGDLYYRLDEIKINDFIKNVPVVLFAAGIASLPNVNLDIVNGKIKELCQNCSRK